MKCTFITASVDRHEDLQNCVTSIEKAYGFAKNIEIEILIVSGRGENEGAPIKAAYPHLVKYCTSVGLGLARRRNVGIEESAGDYLIFLDDDAAVKEDLLERLAADTQAKAAGAFCGRILDPRDDSPFTGCYKDDRVKRLSWFDFQYFKGSSVILKKEIIEKIGLFDEEFGAGARYHGAEESDIFFRLKQAGEDVVYLPDAVFYHRISEAPSGSKVFNYAYAVGAMFMKQIVHDRPRFFIYAAIILDRLIKSLARMAQNILLPWTMEGRNERYRYGLVFSGTIKGIFDYLRFNVSPRV